MVTHRSSKTPPNFRIKIRKERHLNVKEVLGQNVRSFVDGLAGSVENTSKHVFRDGHAKNIAGKFAGRMLGVDTRSSFEHLMDGKYY